jgi:hypothetical protein
MQCIAKKPMNVISSSNMNKNNNEKATNNYLKNVPCKMKWHLICHFHINPIVVTKDNNILKLKSFLKHNNFLSRHAYKFEL